MLDDAYQVIEIIYLEIYRLRYLSGTNADENSWMRSYSKIKETIPCHLKFFEPFFAM